MEQKPIRKKTMASQFYNSLGLGYLGSDAYGVANAQSGISYPASSYNKGVREFTRPGSVHREKPPRRITQSAREKQEIHRIVDEVYFRHAQVQGPELVPADRYNLNRLPGNRRKFKREGRYSKPSREKSLDAFKTFYKRKDPPKTRTPSGVFAELDKMEARGFDKFIIKSIRDKLKAGAVYALTPTERIIYDRLLRDALVPFMRQETVMGRNIPVATTVDEFGNPVAPVTGVPSFDPSFDPVEHLPQANPGLESKYGEEEKKTVIDPEDEYKSTVVDALDQLKISVEDASHLHLQGKFDGTDDSDIQGGVERVRAVVQRGIELGFMDESDADDVDFAIVELLESPTRESVQPTSTGSSEEFNENLSNMLEAFTNSLTTGESSRVVAINIERVNGVIKDGIESGFINDDEAADIARTMHEQVRIPEGTEGLNVKFYNKMVEHKNLILQSGASSNDIGKFFDMLNRGEESGAITGEQVDDIKNSLVDAVVERGSLSDPVESDPVAEIHELLKTSPIQSESIAAIRKVLKSSTTKHEDIVDIRNILLEATQVEHVDIKPDFPVEVKHGEITEDLNEWLLNNDDAVEELSTKHSYSNKEIAQLGANFIKANKDVFDKYILPSKIEATKYRTTYKEKEDWRTGKVVGVWYPKGATLQSIMYKEYLKDMKPAKGDKRTDNKFIIDNTPDGKGNPRAFSAIKKLINKDPEKYVIDRTNWSLIEIPTEAKRVDDVMYDLQDADNKGGVMRENPIDHDIEWLV